MFLIKGEAVKRWAERSRPNLTSRSKRARLAADENTFQQQLPLPSAYTSDATQQQLAPHLRIPYDYPLDITSQFVPLEHIEIISKLEEPVTRESETSALFTETVDPSNRQFLRTHHRSLRDFPVVMIMTRLGHKAIWLVDPFKGINVQDTHIGGLELQIAPSSFPAHSMMHTYSQMPDIIDDPILRIINSRRILLDSDLLEIQRIWPLAVGARVFVSGFLVILFPDTKALNKTAHGRCPESFGNLRIHYDVFEIETTLKSTERPASSSSSPGPNLPLNVATALTDETDTIIRNLPFRAALSSIPNDGDAGYSFVGLRLRLLNGDEVLTAITHGFVNYRKMSAKIDNRTLSEIYKLIKIKLSTLNPVKLLQPQPSKVMARQKLANSPIGVKVFQSDTNICVGTITKTFDPIIETRPVYPVEFVHDLCLIADPDLPQIRHMPGVPRISEWGSYADVLDGCPVLVVRTSMSSSSSSSSSTQQALTVGVQYFFNRDIASSTSSLLWRTITDHDNALGWSGSVLCCGKQTDHKVQAVLFQNFEIPVRPGILEGNDQGSATGVHNKRHGSMIKGGFLLPNEIRQAQILVAEEEEEDTTV